MYTVTQDIVQDQFRALDYLSSALNRGLTEIDADNKGITLCASTRDTPPLR
jgi:hypothetical protein